MYSTPTLINEICFDRGVIAWEVFFKWCWQWRSFITYTYCVFETGNKRPQSWLLYRLMNHVNHIIPDSQESDSPAEVFIHKSDIKLPIKVIFIIHVVIPWWRHQMKTFSALLALCAGNSPVTGEFPTQRPVTRSFDVFFDLRLNKPLRNNRGTGDLRRLRAHYDVIVMRNNFYKCICAE